MCQPNDFHIIEISFPYLPVKCELIHVTDTCSRNRQCNRTEHIWFTSCFNLCPSCQLFPSPFLWLALPKIPNAGHLQVFIFVEPSFRLFSSVWVYYFILRIRKAQGWVFIRMVLKYNRETKYIFLFLKFKRQYFIIFSNQKQCLNLIFLTIALDKNTSPH